MGTQNQIGQLAQKNYGVFVPFLSNKIISGSGLATQGSGGTIDIFSFNGPSQFQYQYFLYLKKGVTYRFSCGLLKTSDSGILSATILSANGLTTYNTLSNIDNYKSGSGATWNIVQQTFSFSPSGFNDGDWVTCILNCFCNSKNASSTNFYILGVDPGSGFNFCEKYS